MVRSTLQRRLDSLQEDKNSIENGDAEMDDDEPNQQQYDNDKEQENEQVADERPARERKSILSEMPSRKRKSTIFLDNEDFNNIKNNNNNNNTNTNSNNIDSNNLEKTENGKTPVGAEKSGLKLKFKIPKPGDDETSKKESSKTNERPAREKKKINRDEVVDHKVEERRKSARKNSALPPAVIKLFHSMLSQLNKLDQYSFFQEVPDDSLAPHYSTTIASPMAFNLMSSKLKAGDYQSLDDFSKDFYLICTNCMNYNLADSVYYKEAQKMVQDGEKIINSFKPKIEIAYNATYTAGSGSPVSSVISSLPKIPKKPVPQISTPTEPTTPPIPPPIIFNNNTVINNNNNNNNNNFNNSNNNNNDNKVVDKNNVNNNNNNNNNNNLHSNSKKPPKEKVEIPIITPQPTPIIPIPVQTIPTPSNIITPIAPLVRKSSNPSFPTPTITASNTLFPLSNNLLTPTNTNLMTQPLMHTSPISATNINRKASEKQPTAVFATTSLPQTVQPPVIRNNFPKRIAAPKDLPPVVLGPHQTTLTPPVSQSLPNQNQNAPNQVPPQQQQQQQQSIPKRRYLKEIHADSQKVTRKPHSHQSEKQVIPSEAFIPPIATIHYGAITPSSFAYTMYIPKYTSSIPATQDNNNKLSKDKNKDKDKDNNTTNNNNAQAEPQKADVEQNEKESTTTTTTTTTSSSTTEFLNPPKKPLSSSFIAHNFVSTPSLRMETEKPYNHTNAESIATDLTTFNKPVTLVLDKPLPLPTPSQVDDIIQHFGDKETLDKVNKVVAILTSSSNPISIQDFSPLYSSQSQDGALPLWVQKDINEFTTKSLSLGDDDLKVLKEVGVNLDFLQNIEKTPSPPLSSSAPTAATPSTPSKSSIGQLILDQNSAFLLQLQVAQYDRLNTLPTPEELRMSSQVEMNFSTLALSLPPKYLISKMAVRNTIGLSGLPTTLSLKRKT